jgi:hypothetical protein
MKTRKLLHFGCSNELSSVNTLQVCKLSSRSRTSGQSIVSLYCDCSGSTDNVLMFICEM